MDIDLYGHSNRHPFLALSQGIRPHASSIVTPCPSFSSFLPFLPLFTFTSCYCFFHHVIVSQLLHSCLHCSSYVCSAFFILHILPLSTLSPPSSIHLLLVTWRGPWHETSLLFESFKFHLCILINLLCLNTSLGRRRVRCKWWFYFSAKVAYSLNTTPLIYSVKSRLETLDVCFKFISFEVENFSTVKTWTKSTEWTLWKSG